MIRLSDKTMLGLAAALCLTVFSAGALLGTMMEYTRPKPPCYAAGNGGMVATSAICDAVAQRALMRLLFAQPK